MPIENGGPGDRLCPPRDILSQGFDQNFPELWGIKLLQALSHIQDPNIAKLYDVYLFSDKILVASEHLELSLAELNLHSFPSDEWEI